MTDAAAPAAPEMGLFSRAIGIVTSPKATFGRALQVPRPAGILFLCALGIALATGVPQLTERGRQAALEMQVKTLEQRGQAVTPEMYSQLETVNKYGAYVVLASTFIMVPVMALLFTAIYWAIFNAIMGGTATFKSVLTVVAHSQVIGVLGLLLGAPIQYVKGVVTVGGPFNLGALAPSLDQTSFLARYLGSMNVFTLWGLIVTGMGLGVLYRRNGTNIGIALIVVYLVLAAGFISLFGSLMGR
jgi:Yip1 domain